MRVVVIGGTGHIGGYLIPRLIKAGHEVISVSRQQHDLYHLDPAWESVNQVTIDRSSAEQQGRFGKQIRDLNADAIIDLICFTPQSAEQLIDAVANNIQHFLHCGSIWVHGHSVCVPTTEEAPRVPFGDYAANKVTIEALLLDRAASGFPATILHPGHIVGPGWAPVNPQGHFNAQVFADLKEGMPLSLPNLGMETLHHVHADDVALAFVQALNHRANALGESFHVASAAALTLRGYAESMAAWFSQPAELRFAPLKVWLESLAPEDSRNAYDHIVRSQNCSIDKARRLIDYQPRHSSLQAIQESVRWLIEHEHLHAAQIGSIATRSD